MFWKKSWLLISLLFAALVFPSAAEVVTTTVSDTIYHADGSPATGTILISWPAFTTSMGDQIAAGSTSVSIAADGAFSAQLIPDSGAIPIGSYYTVDCHLDDGSVMRQYWIVPASATPVRLAAIESAVLPTSVAMQTASRSYVDTSIAAAVAGHPLDSTPYLLKQGDTMAGPLTLPSDPVAPMQAASKNYVDSSTAQLTTGINSALKYRGVYASGTSYNANDVVISSGIAYVSQINSNTGNDPATNAWAWQPLSASATARVTGTQNALPAYTANPSNGTADLGPSHLTVDSSGYNIAGYHSTWSNLLVGTSDTKDCNYNIGLFGQSWCAGVQFISSNYTSGAPNNSAFGVDFRSYGHGAAAGSPVREGKYSHGIDDDGSAIDGGGFEPLLISAGKYGGGDFIPIAAYWFNHAGCTYDSDQCSQGIFMQGGQGFGYFHAQVATGGSGATTVTVSNIGGCAGFFYGGCNAGPMEHLTDIAQGGPSGRFTGTASQWAPANWLYQIPTSGGLPVNAWGVAASLNYAPALAIDNPKSTTITFQKQGGPAFTTGLACVASDSWVEQARITAVSGTAPSQTITLPLALDHRNVTVWQGANTCSLLSMDADLAASGYRTGYIYAGSPDGSSMVAGIEQFSGFGGPLPQPGVEMETTDGGTDSGFHLYCQARVLTIPTPWPTFTAILEPNGCNWAANDAVEAPDFDAQQQNGMHLEVNQNTPSTTSAYEQGGFIQIGGFGAAGSAFGMQIDNANHNVSWYTPQGGRLYEPTLFSGTGFWSNGFVLDQSPGGTPGVEGALLKINNIQGSQTEFDLFASPWGQLAAQSGSFRIKNAGLSVQEGVSAASFGTSFFSADGGGNVVGSNLTLQPSTNGSSKLTMQATSADTWMFKPEWASDTDANMLDLWNLTAGIQPFGFYSHAGTTRLDAVANGVYGWVSGTSYAGGALDTGISRCGADCVALGNGAQGDNSAALNVGSITAHGTSTNAVVALAPSGADAWLFFGNGSSNHPGWFGVYDATKATEPLGVYSADATHSFVNFDPHTVAGWAPASETLPDTGLSRLNAGSLAVGNGTAGDTSGSLSAAQVSANLYKGPATAPTGACSAIGWVFSQDGHISYCNGTTWTQKM